VVYAASTPGFGPGRGGSTPPPGTRTRGTNSLREHGLGSVPVPAHLLVRLPLGLPQRRAGLPGGLRRMALCPPVRFLQHLRLDPRPQRRLLAHRAARPGGPGQPPLRPGDERPRDHLDDRFRLARGPGRAHPRRLAPRERLRAPPTPAPRRRGRAHPGAPDRVPAGGGRRRDDLPARLRLRRDPCGLGATRRRRHRRGGQPRRHPPDPDRGSPHGGRRVRCARPPPHEAGRGPLQRAQLGPLPTAAGVGGGLRAASAAHDRLLAPLARGRQLPRPPLARLPAALRSGPQGTHLLAHRRADRRAHHFAARDARRRAQLGLPLHLDPRLDLHALGPAHCSTPSTSTRRSRTTSPTSSGRRFAGRSRRRSRHGRSPIRESGRPAAIPSTTSPPS
jgi:hypothetical protein